MTEAFSSGEQTQATLLPQLYVALNRRGHVGLAVGVEVPLAGLDYDYRIRTFLLWDIGDGPLWEGW